MPGSAYSGAPAPSGLRGLIDWLLRRRLPPESKTPVAAPERPAAPPPVAVAGSQPNWLRMLDAQALLQVVQADKAIAEI